MNKQKLKLLKARIKAELTPIAPEIYYKLDTKYYNYFKVYEIIKSIETEKEKK